MGFLFQHSALYDSMTVRENLEFPLRRHERNISPKELDKAVEIDCYPDRQDLNVELLRLARKAGCRVSLGTDAHHPWQLSFIELGLAASMMAGLPPDRILNFMPRNDLVAWVERVRAS